MDKIDFVFHHVGVFTEDMPRAVEFYSSLKYTKSEVFTDLNQGAKIIIMEKSGSPLVELISPIEGSGLINSLGRKSSHQPGTYHCCYQVKNLTETLKISEQNGFKVIMEPTSAIAFEGKMVAFVWSPFVGLLEFLENR